MPLKGPRALSDEPRARLPAPTRLAGWLRSHGPALSRRMGKPESRKLEAAAEYSIRAIECLQEFGSACPPVAAVAAGLLMFLKEYVVCVPVSLSSRT